MKEFELAAEMDYLMQKNGADKADFETISYFEKNTSEQHYTHGTTVFKKGDFILWCMKYTEMRENIQSLFVSIYE